MLTDFVFDFEAENKRGVFGEGRFGRVYVGRHRLVKPIFGANYVQLVVLIPFFSFGYVVTCDLIDDFLSNNEHNKGEPVLGMSADGEGGYPLIPISRDPINEITVRSFHYRDKVFVASNSLHVKLLLRIFHTPPPTILLEMKQTVLFLRLERSSNSMNVNYQFPKPLHGVKWIRVLSWITDKGHDYVMCPILADPCWGSDVDMPLLAFGETDKSRMCEAKRVAEQHSTMNSLIIKMVRPNNGQYKQDFALIHLVIFHE